MNFTDLQLSYFENLEMLCRKYGIQDLHSIQSLPNEEDAKQQLQHADKMITACFLEGGILFHSIFVGINYGISENNSTSIALLIALIFHQVSLLFYYLFVFLSMAGNCQLS